MIFGHGDTETWETRRRGDKESGRFGDGNYIFFAIFAPEGFFYVIKRVLCELCVKPHSLLHVSRCSTKVN